MKLECVERLQDLSAELAFERASFPLSGMILTAFPCLVLLPASGLKKVQTFYHARDQTSEKSV